MNHSKPNQPPLSPEEIEVRIWGFVVIVVTLILAGIVFFMLYSVTFVTQPIKSMAPIDQGYLKMLNDIVLLIVGGIGGVMSKKGVSAIASAMAAPTPPPAAAAPAQGAQPPLQSPVTGGPFGNAFGAMPVFINPELDESWTPPPPPTTPANYLPPEAADIAAERAAARSEA